MRRNYNNRRPYGIGPAGCPLHHQLDVYHGLADDKAVIDYGFHGVVQHVDESILNELETMMDDGVQSTKVYMTYGYKIDDDGTFKVLKKMKELHRSQHSIARIIMW